MMRDDGMAGIVWYMCNMEPLSCWPEVVELEGRLCHHVSRRKLAKLLSKAEKRRRRGPLTCQYKEEARESRWEEQFLGAEQHHGKS